MRYACCAAFLAGLSLASGCFQEAAPRHETPTDVTAVTLDQHAVSRKSVDAVPVETAATVPQLAKRLQDDADPKVRREALYQIADAGEAEDAALIGQALYDPDGEVRMAAVEALTGIGGEASANWLSIGLGDPDPRVRRTAVEALGQVGGDTARFLLEQALADTDASVREAARQMLGEPGFAGDGVS